DLVEDVGLGAQRDKARRFGGPHVLPAAERGVDELCCKLVHELREARSVALGVCENTMPVIGHYAKGGDLDGETLAGAGEDVEECEVGGTVGTKEKLALCATTREEISRAREDLSWKRHVKDIGASRRTVAGEI